MQTKLKKQEVVAALSSSAYTMKIKSELNRLAELPTDTAPIPFLFHAEFDFADETAPLFIAGLNNHWKKTIKNDWLKSDLKNILFGTCSKKNDVIELLVKKGKLTQTRFNTAVKKNAALKKMTWNIVEAFEDDDSDLLNDDPNEDLTPASSQPSNEANTEADKAKSASLNAQILKLVAEMKTTSGEAKRQVLIKIDQVADQLYKIPNWEDYTDDRIEQLLTQVEAALSEQNREENKDDKDLKQAQKAQKLVKEIASLFAPFRNAKNDEKKKLLNNIQQLSAELAFIPNWEDYTPDALEKAIAQIDDMYNATLLCDDINEALVEFKAAKTPEEKQQLQSEIQSLSINLFAIPNWRNYTDDKLEKIIAPMAPTKVDEEFIAHHNAALAQIATAQAFADYAQQIAQQANTAATRAYANNIIAAAESMQITEKNINTLLDQQEELSKLIQSGELSGTALTEAQNFLDELIALTSTALN